MTKSLDPRASGRAIKFAGTKGGMTLDEINEMLTTVGLDPMAESSFEMIKSAYVPLFLEDTNVIGSYIRSPGNLSDVSARRGQTG